MIIVLDLGVCMCRIGCTYDYDTLFARSINEGEEVIAISHLLVLTTLEILQHSAVIDLIPYPL